MKAIEVNCIKCNKDFYLKASNIKKKFIDKVKVEYFKCKHCQERYISMCTDDYVKDKKNELKKLEREIASLAKKFTLSCTEETLQEMDKAIEAKDKLRTEMKAYIDKLREEFKDRV